jgi:hypothetical protein
MYLSFTATNGMLLPLIELLVLVDKISIILPYIYGAIRGLQQDWHFILGIKILICYHLSLE